MTDLVPLTTLLSWAWVAHTIEIDNVFEAATADRVGRCVRISLPMWTNGLRQIDETGVTVDQVRARTGARCNLGGLERWGWISVAEPGAERRAGYGSHRGITGDTLLRPTRAGRYARRVWPAAVDTVESRWRVRFGAEVVDRLRAALPAAPTDLAGLPWSPPEVNPADGFRTQVVGQFPGESAGLAAAEPPLVAQLGQALTRLTLRHEQAAAVSLPLGANLMRMMDGDPVRSRDLASLAGVSKEAVAMAVGYLVRRRLAITTAEKDVVLTPEGLAVVAEHRRRSAAAVDEPLRAALHDVLTQTDALTVGLVPPQGGWRGTNPYLAQTRRLLADPTGALPWHPMVLHRAGWPDGS